MEFLGKSLILAAGVQPSRRLSEEERRKLSDLTADWAKSIVLRAEEVGRKRREAIETLDDEALKAALKEIVQDDAGRKRREDAAQADQEFGAKVA